MPETNSALCQKLVVVKSSAHSLVDLPFTNRLESLKDFDGLNGIQAFFLVVYVGICLPSSSEVTQHTREPINTCYYKPLYEN